MRSMVTLVIVLTLVCLISALALALVNGLTDDRIAEQKRLARLRAVAEALPRDDVGYDNDPSEDITTATQWRERDGTLKKIYLGRSNGRIVGAAFTSVGEGYGGRVTIMMGVDLGGKVMGIEILEHLETPGLGANIESPKLGFEDQFRGKSSNGSPEGNLVVVKMGEADENWEVEALTGATVSPRAVVQAVNGGLEKFLKYGKQILAGETPKEGTK